MGIDFGLLREAERVNKQRIDRLMEKIQHFLWVVRDKQIGILGLAFKPFTDDIRLAPALEVIRRLLAAGARLRATDPEAMERTRALHPDIAYSADPYEVARGADALLLLTEWPEYKQLDWPRIRKLSQDQVLSAISHRTEPSTRRRISNQAANIASVIL